MHDAYNHWIQLIARYPDLHDVYHRGVHDFESLEGTDRGRFFALMHGEFRNFEEIYPGVQAWWRLRSHWFSEKFVKFVDQFQQTAKPPQGFREAVPDQRLTNRSS